MSKTKHIPHIQSDMVSEPTAAYGEAQVDHRSATSRISKEKRIPSNTMSVDEYFDKLRSLVHDDYANL